MFLFYRTSLLSTLIIGFLFLDLQVLGAHGFGERYDLPVPLNWYPFGAGSVSAIFFISISIFSNSWKPR